MLMVFHAFLGNEENMKNFVIHLPKKQFVDKSKECLTL